MRRLTLITILALALAGCSKSAPHAESTLTEHQRDSVLAKSSLPGATVVGRAMATDDAEARRAANMNAQVDSLPH
jgi:PBP1b-binding outer membrane lipoprotein LpoB